MIKAHALAAVLKANHTWLCPTLTMRHHYAILDDPRLPRDWRLKYANPSWRSWWLDMTAGAHKAPPGEWSKRRALVRSEDRLVAEMQRDGVGILAGTDTSNPFCIPGFALHDELARLVDCGLSPMEALRTATSNPARFTGRRHDLGSIAPGKLADLVVLDANPLADIRNIARIRAVVLNGRYLDRRMLDHILSEVALSGQSVKPESKESK